MQDEWYGRGVCRLLSFLSRRACVGYTHLGMCAKASHVSDLMTEIRYMCLRRPDMILGLMEAYYELSLSR